MGYEIKTAALGYEDILNCLKSTTFMMSISEIWARTGVHSNVSGPQQISDAVKSFHKKGIIGRTKYGRGYSYFYKHDKSPQPQGLALKSVFAVDIDAKLAKTVPPAVPSNKPEIIVNETSIIINHAKCKITIEF